MGINIENEAMTCVDDALYDVMLEGNMDYDYDDYGGISWVAYWCSSDESQKGFRRVKEYIYLPDAGAPNQLISPNHPLALDISSF